MDGGEMPRANRLGFLRSIDEPVLGDVAEVFGLDVAPAPRTQIVLPPGDDEVLAEGVVLGAPFQRRAFRLTTSAVRVGNEEMRFSDIASIAHWIVRGDVLGSPLGLTFHIVLATRGGYRVRVVSTGSARRRSGNGRDLFELATHTIEAHSADRIVTRILDAVGRIGTARIGEAELSPEGVRIGLRPLMSWSALAVPQSNAASIELMTGGSLPAKAGSIARTVPNAVLLGRVVAAAKDRFG
jgi:hypothetical protein